MNCKYKKKSIIILSFLFLFLFASVLHSAPATRPKIGLVLSGGGAKGLAHIGVLKVFEEAGLKPDFITGTSMGAIIGALYAIGYDAKTIEELALSANWEELLSDATKRKNISLEEKEEDGKYIGTFPIRNRKIRLPSGLVAGQNFSVFISRLTLPVHHVENFRTFPTPFLCVATDLETGEAVVLDKGFLPDALRASMSIPTIFTPVEIDGRLLVDGFLVRNFPVEDAKEMGADIVIGVDVGAPLYSKEELNSLIRVMEQSINFRGAESTEKQHNLCDILIMPDLEDYTTTSFINIDSIIHRGEQAAGKNYSKLKSLADSLNSISPFSNTPTPLKPINNLYITELDIEGLKEVSRRLVTGKLRIDIPSVLTPSKVEDAIERVYGTNFFERITYKLEPASVEGSRLVLRMVEQTDDQFKFGIHYDSDAEAQILLNTTFRNVLREGSRLQISWILGEEQSSFEGEYFVPSKFNIPIGYGTRLLTRNFDITTYTQSGKTEGLYSYLSTRLELYLQTIFSNTFALGLSVAHNHSSIEIVLAPEDYSGNKYGLSSFAGYLKIDSFNKNAYPRKGVQLYAESRYHTNLLSTDNLKDMKPFFAHMLTCSSAIPLHRKISILASFYGGIIDTNAALYDLFYSVGGVYSQWENSYPFLGLRFMERLATKTYIFQTGIQYEFNPKTFLLVRGNIGQTIFKLLNFREEDNHLFGAGLTLGWHSPIGPMEYTLSWGSERKYLLSYLNLGYRF